jgi:Domain of unknown function (DUF4157)/L,D-transpeptidase catalytic domain
MSTPILAVEPPAKCPPTSSLLRRCACDGTSGGECAACRERRLRRASGPRAMDGAAAPRIVHDVLRSPGEPLDRAARAALEPHFGHDFGRVRVHADARAGASARAVGAAAYAVGSDLVFGSGRYAPHTSAGRGLLAHELAHVVQAPHGPGPSGALRVGPHDDQAERDAEAIAARLASGGNAAATASAAPALRRAKEPYISTVSVSLTPPESGSLTWKGTAPQGTDSFKVSTGKGYQNPEDDPGTCTRDCCSGADVQCAPPWEQPKRVGACCTPIGSFHTGKPILNDPTRWPYWTPVEPLHTTYGRGIALHQHDTVTGDAIGHGCIRMQEAPARRIAEYSRGAETKVVISGRAKVDCPADRACAKKTGMLEEAEEPSEALAANLSHPDEEPGGGGASAITGEEPAPEVAA